VRAHRSGAGIGARGKRPSNVDAWKIDHSPCSCIVRWLANILRGSAIAQGHDDNINALQSTAAGPVASDREFGLTLSELTALQAKKMMADKQSHLQRMSSYRFDRRANQGKQRMGGRAATVAVQSAMRDTLSRRDVG
jgi:hypothetical protein